MISAETAECSSCCAGFEEIDPICGMTVDPDHAAGSSRHAGATYYFCNPRCKQKFDANPLAYIVPREKTKPPPSPAGAIYTCPMDAEVRQLQAGACPKCGMALEPEAIAIDEKNPELQDMSRRFRISLVLTAPLVAFVMLRHLPGAHEILGHTLIASGRWIELALATPVVLWGGWPFFERAWRSVVTRYFNMFTLIGLGVTVGYVYSLVATLFPQIFPPSFRDASGHVNIYFEPAAAIVTLVLLGQVMELRARSRTGAAIRALLGLAPKSARRVNRDGSEKDIPLDEVKPGDTLRIRPGEKNPGRWRCDRGLELRR